MTELNSSNQTVIVVCAFCKGQGRDPFEIMSPLSTCQVCSGAGRHTLLYPIVACAYCRGSGVHPHSRLTCTSCRGIGAVHAPTEAVVCPACHGSGKTNRIRWPDSPFSCGYCRGAGVVSKVQAALLMHSDMFAA